MSVDASDAALLLDLYELTMASSYLAHGMRGDATFDLFVRKLPGERNFLVACGLERALEYLETLHFDAHALACLRNMGLFNEAFLTELGKLRFTGEVWAVPEGELVFAEEPILRVTGPIAEAQLVETFLLNCVLFETMIASKAARVTLAARGKAWSEFGMRRAHGSDAAVRGGRAAYLAGAGSTSNVLSASQFGIPPSGTMAHSFVMAFDTERHAYETFAGDHGERTILLIDTWDTLQGARIAAEVARVLVDQGDAIRGVRIDSGDFMEASRAVRKILDDAGHSRLQIFISGDLDEHQIARLLDAGAPIDAFGVGTQVATSADAPALGGVYKLSEYAGSPRMKLSAQKITLPGRKQVFRVEESGRWVKDVIALENETIPNARPLLEPIMRGGRRLNEPESLTDARARCLRRIAALPEPLRDLEHPVKWPVERSPGLQALIDETTAQLRSRSP